MLCPLVPCSSRAKETTVLSPVSNGQPILFSLGISLLWLQLYMYVTWSSFSLIIFGWLYTDFFFSLEHLWFLYISPDFWVDLCHLCFFVVFVVVGIMFPFFLQVLLVVVWFMTIRFLYVLVGPVYLSQVWYAISWVILGTLSISSVSCVLFFAIKIIVLVWCHPVYFCLMGCFCLHRVFLVTHVQELTGKKIHHHIIFYHCG